MALLCDWLGHRLPEDLACKHVQENATLMRESVQFSFSLDNVVDHPLSRAAPAASEDVPGESPKGL